jgi:nucleoside-diphosphate-sugar epimerase
MNKAILVTGGTGYIGSWVVKYLLEKGYSVRTTVRNKNNTEKYKHLIDLAKNVEGKLEIFEADLLKDGSFDEAARGANAIIHVASPFTLRFKNAQRDLLDPALKGTRNVLNAANKSESVTKVVLTSSVAAVNGDNIDLQEKGIEDLTEEHYNTTSSAQHQPYSYSKLIAEKEAWNMAKGQNQWKLVVINPSFVMGPSLANTSESESINLMKDMLKGKFLLGVPDLMFGFVDVRDVAQAHILALENDSAEGRHILAERTMNFMGLANIIRENYGNKYPLPKFMAPKLILILIGSLFGVTAKFVKRNVGYSIAINATKSKEALGLNYRDINETIKDMISEMHKQKIV